MKPIIEILEDRVSQALSKVCNSQEKQPALVRASANPKFGDYQANGVMGLAKKLGKNPRELAAEVVEILDVSDICESVEVAGPGFINLKVSDDFISSSLLEINSDESGRLAIDEVDKKERIVVDYSGPNIAKEMHVGHLRSTIIGDCISELYSFLGHDVIRQNHIGDWGTQFGMLCALYERKRTQDGLDQNSQVNLSDLEAFYKEAKALYDSDEEFAKTARAAIAGLHSGDEYWKKDWQAIVNESRKHYSEIYGKLNVSLSQEDEYGESAYKDSLQEVVDQLKDSGKAVISDGAVCVFPDGFKNKEGEPLPFIIQKSDYAFLYATTDLAAMKYRVEKLGAERIVYVTDARQMLHFKMLFAVSRDANIAKESTKLAHVTFGTMLGDDGKPFKTRSGENVKLKDLLNEAVDKARSVVEAKNPQLSQEEKDLIAENVGIGAVKYSDYSNNRTTDYIFSFDKMLAMDGNTAPYMQYACARVNSIESKAKEKGIDVQAEISSIKKVNLLETYEAELAKQLLKYSEAIKTAAADYRPNYLTNYLYELAQKFSSFYTNCPVLIADENSRPTRLLLCNLTAKTLLHGLETILRIKVPQQM